MLNKFYFEGAIELFMSNVLNAKEKDGKLFPTYGKKSFPILEVKLFFVSIDIPCVQVTTLALILS